MSSIRFLLFEIKRVFVYNSTIFYLTDLFILYFFLQNAYADKKVFLKKKLKNVFNGSNCDRKSQRSGIMTEPLNPHDMQPENFKIYDFIFSTDYSQRHIHVQGTFL